MMTSVDTLPELRPIPIRDLLSELAIRQFGDDPLERWIATTWPLRDPEESVRRELASISDGALAKLLINYHSATPTSILTKPGEKFEDQNDLAEVRQMTTEAQWRAREATVGILRAPAVKQLPGREFAFTTERFRGCAGESFAGQPRGPNATGVLVGPALVLTAGHFVAGRPAKSMYFFFDYILDSEGRAPERFSEKAVYRGREIVAICHQPPTLGSLGADWALVRLDRPVENRRPLAVRRAGKIGDQRPLFVVGHPAGFPMKYALDGVVVDNEARQLFRTTLDIVGGGSGSPVFDAEADDPIVEGIVIRGGLGFVNDPNDPTCIRYFRTGDITNYGTVCTRATEFADSVPR